MGNYLSRARPGAPPLALRSRDQTQRPERLGPSHLARRVPSAFRVHSASLHLTRRRSYEDHVAAPRRQHRRQLVLQCRPRPPFPLARCLLLGVFSAAPWSGPHKKPVLTVSSSRMFCPSVVLNLASAKGKLTLRLALQQSVLTIWSSLTGHFSIPYVKETRLRALEERTHVKAEEDEHLTTLGDGGEGLAKQQEDHTVPERQNGQGRGTDDRESAQSAFRCLMVNGMRSSFVPRPGPLKGEFCSGNSLITKSQTSSLISCSKRNAITSSYSSTHGFPLLQERIGTSPAGLFCPASSHFQVSAKSTSEEGHQASSYASVVPQRKITHKKVTDAPSRQQQNPRSRSPPSDLSRPRKRKVPLLLPYRRNDPLILPPSPQPGYPITAEDLDLEKRAAIQWINKVLKGGGAKTQSS